MNAKLTEAPWKDLVSKNKIKDNGLQKALAAYENLGEDDFDGQLKSVNAIKDLAEKMKKVKEVTALKDAIKWLDALIAAAKAEPGALKTATAAAEKAAAAAAAAAEAEEDESGDTITKVKTALNSLKTAKAPYFFLACDTKPFGLILSKKDITKNAQAKKDLAALAGGSTRPPKFGTCKFVDGRYVFEMDKPPTGLASSLQKWVKTSTGLGLKMRVGDESADDDTATAKPAADEWSMSPDTAGFSPVAAGPGKFNLDPTSPEMRNIIMKGVEESMEKERKELEAAVKLAKKAIDDARAFLMKMDTGELQRMSYAQVMALVRKNFPDAAGIAQLVKDKSRFPGLKVDLPNKSALLDMVNDVADKRGFNISKIISASGNPAALAMDKLLAAYMSELPAGLSVDIKNGVVQLTAEGAALKVKTAAGDVEATAGKSGAYAALKSKDYAIEVSNEGWKDFDPKLRGNWQRINAEASEVATLEASLKEVKADYEKKKKDGTEISADFKADIEKREGEFNLRWKKLQESVTANAKASMDKISANIDYLKKDKNNKEAVKAGVALEVDLKEMKGTLKAYAATPSVKALLEVSASVDKVAAKLEVTALKSGTVITASFEKALDETKAAIEILMNEGKTKLAAELKKKADDLTAKVKLVHEGKNLKLAAELEKTLTEVRGAIELEYKRGNTAIKAGATGSTSGEVGGKAQIDIQLEQGIKFLGDGQALSFAAEVSNKGYKFEVSFSMGKPVESTSIQDLFKDAKKQIEELYKLAGDSGIRSIEDVKALNTKIQELVKPITETAKKVKTLSNKRDIQASFGFEVAGDWPVGGKVNPPTGTFNFKLAF